MSDLVERLLFMADAGDMGRKPDPDDVRRIAADTIQPQAARIKVLGAALRADQQLFETNIRLKARCDMDEQRRVIAIRQALKTGGEQKDG